MSTPPSRPAQPPAAAPGSEKATAASVPPKAEELPTGWAAEKKSRDYIDLPEGKELNEITALDLANARPVQWIVLAGPIDSGKTTILTSLYELLQWRKVEGYAFAGSNTLPGFEERCYLSRRASGGIVPHTQRTLYKGPDPLYLHLRVRAVQGLRPFRDFLFTDVSGEMFEHARDSTDECKQMTFLKRANHFLLLLDSAKGIEQDRRWAMFEDGRALLRSIVDSRMLGAHCVVNVVWSRFDYFAAAEANEEQRLFRAQVERELREGLQPHLPNLVFNEVAARPLQAPTLGLGHGVPALLKRWAEAPLDMKGHDLFPKSFSGTRESELFGARHFGSVTRHEESSS